MQLPGDIFFDSVCSLLQEDKDVCITATGCSMLPFIVGGRDKVILHRNPSPKAGDIALARFPGERYILHRILSIDTHGHVVMMGDGNIRGVERCTVADICATVTHVVDPRGRKHDVYSPARVASARVWRALIPARRILLAIYRRTVLKLY